MSDNYHSSRKLYAIRYRVDSFSLHDSDSGERTATIPATTEQSAVHQFNQKFHDCFLIDVREVGDEN
jgi:hypothetical protein